MRKILILFLFLITFESIGQINARMIQYPDVSETHITFAYAGDVWVVEKIGGTAFKLSSPAGPESFPRFSPDGETIAFTGNYDGNSDIYVIDAMGGIPVRITFHGFTDRMVGWSPDGEVLFSSSRESGRQRFNQLYLLSKEGGKAEKLPMAYAEFGSFSDEGDQIAFTQNTRVARNWKRYRGGTAADIYIFDLENNTAVNITNHPANDELPMWNGDNIYYLSDRGEELRNNIWVYDIASKQHSQITNFTDFDIQYPSMGPSDIVFSAGGKLFLLNLETRETREVKIEVVTDQMALQPKTESVKNLMRGFAVAPKGERAIVEARGELFSLPAEHGFVKNLTNTPGAAERSPAWSPDGKHVAFWSDRTGEYELYLMDLENESTRKLTSYGPGFRYQAHWSPDSKKLVFVDETISIKIFNTENKETINVDKGYWGTHGNLASYDYDWSHDSKWLAFSKGLQNQNDAIFLFDYDNKNLTQVTSGFYSDSNPVFDPEGKYIYFTTDRHFSPVYSDFNNSFVYPNATKIAAVALREDVEAIQNARNDEVKMEEEDKEESEEGDDKKKKDDDEDKKEKLAIAIDGFESRVEILPPDAGNYGNLSAVKGKIIYHHYPNSGANSRTRPIKYFDIKEREEKTLMDDADGFEIAAGGEKMLVMNNRSLAIVDIKPGAKMEDKLPLSDMEMTVVPRDEWKQIFMDAWRLQRDYFYDPNMHGVDWDAIGKQYGDLVDEAATRWDVNYLIGEMIAELNASHTYEGGGDTESAKRKSVGYLGVNWEVDNGYYRVAEIIKGADWNAEVVSPLQKPGVDVSEGDYVLAVNGKKLTTDKEPYAAFEGLSNKTVELTVNDKPSQEGARKVIVETMRSETRLRHLAWIEAKRKAVDDATNGKVGYIYVRSTGYDGQSELVRQFNGQWDKEGLIIDERFNSGGQIPDRFIELLNKEPLAYWSVRHGKDWQWPPKANFGAKVMLINGWSGSGGDAFPDYFRKKELGPLIGTRTWGGLIGISGVPYLIDGGIVTVPTFRMYNPDGTWFAEGHGVDPDIEVPEDHTQLAKGVDNQLQRAIEEVKKAMARDPYEKPARPDWETR